MPGWDLDDETRAKHKLHRIQLIGSYTQAKSNGYENYLKKCGLEFIPRKKERLAKQREVIEIDGWQWDKDGNATWHIVQTDLTNDVVNFDISFKVREKIEYTLPWGQKVRSLFKFRGENRLVEKMKYLKYNDETKEYDEDPMDVEIIREFHDGGCYVIYSSWHHTERIKGYKIFLREGYTSIGEDAR